MASGIGRRRQAAQSGGREPYQDRRKKLIAAAAAVFQQKGYGAASLGDVASLLGSDRASLYYYVSSKEELFHAVVFHAAEENVRVVEEIYGSDLPVAEKLDRLIRDLMLSYERHYPYLFVYVQEKMSLFGPEDDEESSEWAADMWDLNRRYEAVVTSIVEEGMDTGVIKNAGRPKVVAYGIIGMLAWTHRWFRPDGPSSGEEISEAFAEMVLKGLLVDSAVLPASPVSPRAAATAATVAPAKKSATKKSAAKKLAPRKSATKKSAPTTKPASAKKSPKS